MPSAAGPQGPRLFFTSRFGKGRSGRHGEKRQHLRHHAAGCEQAPGNSMTPEAKLRLALQLDTLGVDVIEAGFPSASQGDQQAVRGVAEAVRRSAVAALARCHDRDIDLAGEALRPAARPRVHVFIATSDLHLDHKLKISRADCLARAEAAIRRARRYTDDVEFSAEDATRTDLDFLCRVVETAIAAGARTINLPDTVGYAPR